MIQNKIKHYTKETNATLSYLGWSRLPHFLNIIRFIQINTFVLSKAPSLKLDCENPILEHLNQKSI